MRFNNKSTWFYKENQLLNDSTLTLPKKKFMGDVRLEGFKDVKYISGFYHAFPLDHFKLKTRYRYVPIDGYDACLKSHFSITGKKGFLSFPLGHKSCLKGLYVFIDTNSYYYPVIQYPELFSYNSPEWVDVMIIKNPNKVKVYRDNQLIINKECNSSWGDYLFTIHQFISGNGEIDYFQLYDKNDSLVYAKEFNVKTDQ